MLKLGTFSRNVLVILTGTIAAQAITVLVSPLLTRLYTPADFGVYALFSSLLAILGALVAGRYELAITLPAEDRQGLALLALCALVALAVSAATVPVIYFGGGALVRWLGEPRLAPWLWILPGALFLTGVSAAARYWLLRTKAFRTISMNGVLRSLVAAALNVLFGFLAWTQFGLIGGLVLGLVVGTLFLMARIWKESEGEIRQLRWDALREQAAAQRKFPLYSTGSALVESGASQVPVFFFSSLFGAATVGHFALAQRMANLPLTLIATSIGDVFRQEASAVYARDGNCLRLFDRTLLRLFCLAAPAFIAALWLSPAVFNLVFGAEWRESGGFVQILAPALTLRFISSPLSSMFYIGQRQALDFGIQAVLVFVMVGTFWWAGRGTGWSTRQAVGAYSAIYSAKYLVELWLSRRFARGEGAA